MNEWAVHESYKATRPKWKENNANQRWLSLQRLSWGCLEGLALIHTRPNSVLKFLFQASTLASYRIWLHFSLPKDTSRRWLSTSLNTALPKDSLATISMSKGCRFRFQLIWRLFQQFWLRGHSKNRWKLVSSTPELHNTQLKSSKFLFFLLSMLRVFNLSLRRSQKQNLCFPKLLEFHSHGNNWEASVCCCKPL